MNQAAQFRSYFESELAALRDQAVEFGNDHPMVAQELALGLLHGRSGDPHVELLLQSFAFLAGRLRHQLDRDAALLPNTLMAQLFPHLEAPVPTLVIAQLTPRPDAPFEKKVLLEKGRELQALGHDDLGREVPCRLTSVYDTPLVPLEVVQIDETTTSAVEGLDPDIKQRVQSVLHVKLRTQTKEPIHALALDPLRFYIDIEDHAAFPLYNMLAAHLLGVVTWDGGRAVPARPDRHALRWLGFRDDEAALATDLCTHPGYRLLQEYFAFPEKFLFFEVSHLRTEHADRELDLLFLFDQRVEKTMELKQEVLRLNCVPLVNVFRQRIEPVALDQSRFEYRLSADFSNRRFSEIYRIEKLEAIRPGEPVRPLSPYFSLDGFASLASQDYFYVARRVDSETGSVPGTETWVSFLDLQFRVEQPTDEAIGGVALCTQRQLAEQLRMATPLKLQGPGTVATAMVVCKPTPYQPPVLLGVQPWLLISQLLLNHLSLSSEPRALSALKNMLRLHVGHANVTGPQQIDSVQQLKVSPAVFPVWQRSESTIVDGLDITIQIDVRRFDGGGHGGSPILFGEVLSRFFGLYAAVNTVTRLSLETNDVKGEVKTWPPRAGEQIVL